MMNNRQRRSALVTGALSAGLVLCVSVIGQAGTVLYRYTGVIDEVTFDGEGDPFLGTLEPGRRVRGTVRIDPTIDDIFPDNPQRGVYELGLTRRGMRARIGRHVFRSDLPASYADYYTVGMFNDFYGVDELAISTHDGAVKHRGPAVEELQVDHMSIILTDPTATMLDGVTIPFDTPDDFSVLSTNLFAISGIVGPNNFRISGHLTDLWHRGRHGRSVDSAPQAAAQVPEPSTLIALLTGMVALTWGAWRRRRTR